MNKLIKYSKTFKKKETKGNKDSPKFVRCKERIAGIRQRDLGFFVNIKIYFSSG